MRYNVTRVTRTAFTWERSILTIPLLELERGTRLDGPESTSMYSTAPYHAATDVYMSVTVTVFELCSEVRRQKSSKAA